MSGMTVQAPIMGPSVTPFVPSYGGYYPYGTYGSYGGYYGYGAPVAAPQTVTAAPIYQSVSAPVLYQSASFVPLPVPLPEPAPAPVPEVISKDVHHVAGLFSGKGKPQVLRPSAPPPKESTDVARDVYHLANSAAGGVQKQGKSRNVGNVNSTPYWGEQATVSYPVVSAPAVAPVDLNAYSMYYPTQPVTVPQTVVTGSAPVQYAPTVYPAPTMPYATGVAPAAPISYPATYATYPATYPVRY